MSELLNLYNENGPKFGAFKTIWDIDSLKSASCTCKYIVHVLKRIVTKVNCCYDDFYTDGAISEKKDRVDCKRSMLPQKKNRLFDQRRHGLLLNVGPDKHFQFYN